MKRSKRLLTRARPFGLADALMLLGTFLLLLLAFVVAILPLILGLTPCAVASNSMAPTLRRGDLVFLAPTRLEDLAVGNIVAVSLDGSLVTHRVHTLDAAAGTLRTRADASAMLDPYPVRQEQLVGRVVYKIPLLGYVNLLRAQGEVAT